MPNINMKQSNENTSRRKIEGKRNELEFAFSGFFRCLEINNQEFDAQVAYRQLKDYIKRYDRVPYATISNKIYKVYDDSKDEKDRGNILSNLVKLQDWCNDNISNAPQRTEHTKKKSNQEDKNSEIEFKLEYDTQKVIFKMVDHVNLADRQYRMLKQTDDEYNEKFKDRIKEYQDEMTREFQQKISEYQAEMNAQMISMIGIFTALAFLVFGSISSLDGIFENIQFPIFKVMSIGLIWGFCVINMIFVFLYCIGKMTKLSFKSTACDTGYNVIRSYPIVFCTNYAIVCLLVLSLFGWFLQQTGMAANLILKIKEYPIFVFLIGGILVFFGLASLGKCLRDRIRNKS